MYECAKSTLVAQNGPQGQVDACCSLAHGSLDGGTEFPGGSAEVSQADAFLSTLSIEEGPQFFLDVLGNVVDRRGGDASGDSVLLHLSHEVSELGAVKDAIGVDISSLEGGSHLAHELSLGFLGSPLGSVVKKLLLVLVAEGCQPLHSPCCEVLKVFCHLSFLLSVDLNNQL